MRAIRIAHGATGAVFFLCGFGYGTWVPRLAEIKSTLGLSEGLLGIALLMIACGAVLAMPLTGLLIERRGSQRLCLYTLIAAALALPLIALAPSFVTLAVAFFLYGISMGALDVSMNAQTVTVEGRYGRAIMSSMHGLFSLGGMAGAGLAGLAAWLAVGIEVHLLGIGLITLVAGVPACRRMLHDDAVAEPAPAFALPDRGLLLLGVMAFCSLAAEGSVGDWSAVYLSDYLHADTTTAAAAFAAFSVTMAAGRFAGDHLTRFARPLALVGLGGGLAALGLGASLLLGQAWLAVVGYGVVGLGLAVTFPMLISVAGQRSALSPGRAVAAMCTLGYCGFLAGPPTIGLLAEVIGLPLALGVIVGLCAAMALLALAAHAATPRPAGLAADAGLSR